MSQEDFPVGYVVVGAVLPNSMTIAYSDQLRASSSDGISPRRRGDAWVASMTSAVLRVPSLVVPGESNYLLNPKHPEFSNIVVEIPIPFEFDERLFRRG